MNNLIILTIALFAGYAIAIAIPNAHEVITLWDLWKEINHKVYTLEEEANRFEVFFRNYLMIATHNNENEDFKMALNKFADLTDEEFRTQVIGGGFQFDEQENENLRLEQEYGFHIDYSLLSLPEKWDWREHGAVTPVKNQGRCGSCWAFSATGALEGLHFVKNHTLRAFSEQQLVDCEKTSHGCSGGLPWNAFVYASKNGIEVEADYPYEAVDGQCRITKDKALHVNNGWSAVKIRDSEALKAASIQQPISVGVQADQAVFRFYKSGVVKENCGVKLNHGVLVVGYEVVNGDEAFLVKNSWGEDYGDKGYLRVSTDGSANLKAGVCGILLAPTIPTL